MKQKTEVRKMGRTEPVSKCNNTKSFPKTYFNVGAGSAGQGVPKAGGNHSKGILIKVSINHTSEDSGTPQEKSREM